MKPHAFVSLTARFALIAITAVTCCVPPKALAAVVSFGFSGTITSLQNPSNSLPARIALGAPFTGIATYDSTLIRDGMDYDSTTNSGAYYFTTNGGLWLSATIGGHTFDSSTPKAGDPFADIIIYDFNSPYDVFWMDASGPTVRMDGGPMPGNNLTSVGFSMQLYDNSGTALTNDALPLTPPQLSAFPDSHRIEIFAYTSAGLIYSLAGTITNIGPPRPVLNISALPSNTTRLSWTAAAQNFQLEQNTNLVAGAGWKTNSASIVDTATDHTVTIPAAAPMFYRLKSP